jgi:hypothetical protein
MLEEKLTSLGNSYYDQISTAIHRDDHATANSLARAYDKKAARLVARRDGTTPVAHLRKLARRRTTVA